MAKQTPESKKAQRIVKVILDTVEGCGRFAGKKPNRKLWMSPVIRNNKIIPSVSLLMAWVEKELSKK